MTQLTGNIFWKREPETAWMPGYRNYVTSLFEAVEDLLNARSAEIEQWMKDNHVWKNRTRLAEQSLFTAVFRDGLRYILIMGHGSNVPYSRFLERYMQGGRFSVLRPALDYWSPVLLDDLRKLVHP